MEFLCHSFDFFPIQSEKHFYTSEFPTGQEWLGLYREAKPHLRIPAAKSPVALKTGLANFQNQN